MTEQHIPGGAPPDTFDAADPHGAPRSDFAYHPTEPARHPFADEALPPAGYHRRLDLRWWALAFVAGIAIWAAILLR